LKHTPEEAYSPRVINGVIQSKLQTLDQFLAELRTVGTVTTVSLEQDWRTRRAIERNLQVLTEIVVDVCQRLIAVAGQSPAATAGDAVLRCVDLGVFPSAEPYRRMVQFRNFVVHRYERVDSAILADIVNNRLGDFERFRDEVQKYAASAG
jgi:uncharacterized protein YutE (UPF0331/DUF86 family)